MKFNSAYNQLRMQARQEGSDQLLMTKGKEIQNQLKEYNIAFLKRQPAGVFKSFLQTMYPSAK